MLLPNLLKAPVPEIALLTALLPVIASERLKAKVPATVTSPVPKVPVVPPLPICKVPASTAVAA